MTYPKHNTLPKWAIGLFIALALVVGLQSAWLYRLSEHSTRPEKSTAQAVETATTDNTRDALPLTLAPFAADEWNPFAEMQRMRADMDRMFGNALNHFGQSNAFDEFFEPDFALSPHIDITESDKEYTVKVDLPGVESKQIETRLDGQTLTIDARTESASQSKGGHQNGGNILRRERHIGRFTRNIVFDKAVQAEGMTQELKDGVLEIHVPKATS